MTPVHCQTCQSIKGIHKRWCPKAYGKEPTMPDTPACPTCGVIPVNGKCQCPCKPGS